MYRNANDMNDLLSSPDLNLMGDSNLCMNYQRDPCNYITQLFGTQLPAIPTGFFNVHMTKGMIVQPHWHPNCTEVVIVIDGCVLTSVFNPFTRRLMTYQLGPGQVVVFPRGWFHWIVTLSEHTYFLTIFDVPTPDIVMGADFLKCIPVEVLNRAFCIDEAAYQAATAPMKESVLIGPPPGCIPQHSHPVPFHM